MHLFTFAEILKASGGEFVNVSEFNTPIDSIVSDSRARARNALFLALPGEKFDGHDYLADGNPTVADAIMDRVVSDSYRIDLVGESLRPKRRRSANS